MGGVLLGVRIVLAVVFALAAAGKLAGLAGFRSTLSEFGMPRHAVGAAAMAIPLAELGVAALLIPTTTAVAGALAALALLGIFCAAIVRVLARGETPDCGCMGSGRPAPIGPWTLARNAVLGLAAAAIVVGGPGESVADAVASIEAAPWAIAAAVVLVLQGWFGWQLFRQHGRLIERIRALEVR